MKLINLTLKIKLNPEQVINKIEETTETFNYNNFNKFWWSFYSSKCKFFFEKNNDDFILMNIYSARHFEFMKLSYKVFKAKILPNDVGSIIYGSIGIDPAFIYMSIIAIIVFCGFLFYILGADKINYDYIIGDVIIFFIISGLGVLKTLIQALSSLFFKNEVIDYFEKTFKDSLINGA
jgi:hypothetical protein